MSLCLKYIVNCFTGGHQEDRPPADRFDLENESYDKEDMSEQSMDTSEWDKRDVKYLTPYKIKDTDLTREYTCGENERDAKIKELGFVLKDEIGKGAYGRVCLAYRVSGSKSGPVHNKKLACKSMLLAREKFAAKDRKRMADFKNELFTLVKSKHPNIIAIEDHFIVNNHCYLMMEFADEGNLSDRVKKSDHGLAETEAKVFFAQIASAFYYLHCRLGVAHFDLKLSNILVFKRHSTMSGQIYDRLKVSDFGLSRLRFDPKEKKVVKEVVPRGTVPYMSPQVLRLYILNRLDEESVFGKVKPFNPYVADIWSLGICLYLMICREYPFRIEEDPRLLRPIWEEMLRKDFHLPQRLESVLSDGCQDMIEDCIEPNPHKRLTIQNIVGHYWFQDMYEIETLLNPPEDW